MSAGAAGGFVAAPRPAVGEPRAWHFPDTAERTLANGARVVSCHLPGRELISARLVIAAPISTEPEGLDGVAAVMSDALTEGTTTRDRESFADDVERIGATVVAYAAHTNVSLIVSALSRHFDAAFGLAMEALTTPAFAGDDIERLRNTHRDHLQLLLANPAQRAEIALLATLFDAGSRLSRPLGGTARGLDAVTRGAVAGYHAAVLSPSRCTLVVAGDLERFDLTPITDVLGSWTSSTAATPVAAPVPASLSPRVHIVHRPGAAQTELRVGSTGITRRDADWAPLAVASYALGGSMTSRLMQSLREKHGYTYGVSARLVSYGSAGMMVVGTAVETSVTGAAARETLRLVSDVGEQGITPDETAFAIRNIGAAPRRLETAAGVVAVLSEPIAEGLPAGWVREHFERIDAVTPGEASAAARRWGVPMSIVAVGDATRIRPMLEELTELPISVSDAEDQ